MSFHKRWSVFLSVALAVLVGCAGPGWYSGRACVDSEIESRTSHSLGPATDGCETCYPCGVDFEDGISEDEAIATALWNNASYQELLADVGLSRADVMEAHQLTNPHFSTAFPVGVKQLEFTLYLPLEAFWLRPRRLAAAQRSSQQTASRLVQDGLDLIRDVRVAYSDLALAEDRRRIAEKSVELSGRIAELAEARLRAGSASELDVTAARIDSLLQQQQWVRRLHEVDLARQRLRLLLGTPLTEIELDRSTPPPMFELECEVDELVDRALESRPDLQAAQAACAAARHRARLARHDYLGISAMLPDANGKGEKGFEAGPGLTFTIPVFHQNQGAIARADAEVDRAERRCRTLGETIAMEVHGAHTRLAQAREELHTWEEAIVPTVEEAVCQSEKAYENGGASLLLTLETGRRLLDSEVRQAEASAELGRAVAELERSVGRRVFETPSAAVAAMEQLP